MQVRFLPSAPNYHNRGKMMNFEEEAERLLKALQIEPTDNELKSTIMALKEAFICGQQDAAKLAIGIIEAA